MLLHYLELAKQAISDKLQCSVATYLRCDVVVNNRIKKGLLLSLRVKKIKSMNIWQSYKQERGCLVHFARLANTLQKTKKVHETIAFLLVTFCQFKKNQHWIGRTVGRR